MGYFNVVRRHYGSLTPNLINQKFYGWLRMQRDYIDLILTIFTIILILFAIFLASWKLFGNSPTTEQLGSGFITAIGSWLIILTYRLGKTEGKVTQMEKNMKESFERVREDIRELKREFKEDFTEIKQKLK